MGTITPVAAASDLQSTDSPRGQAPVSVLVPTGNVIRPPASRSQIPDYVRQRVQEPLQKTFDVIFGRPPLVAGQDPDAYFAILDRVLVERRPASYDDLILIKRIVNDDWREQLAREMQVAAFNAAIAAEHIDELIESAATKPANSLVAPMGEAQQHGIKQLVFAAVAGDIQATAAVELQLGHRIGVTPQVADRLLQSMPLVTTLEGMITEATSRRDLARRELARVREERIRRRGLTVDEARDALMPSEFFKLVRLIKEKYITDSFDEHPLQRRTSTDPVSVHAPRDEAAASGQTPESQ